VPLTAELPQKRAGVVKIRLPPEPLGNFCTVRTRGNGSDEITQPDFIGAPLFAVYSKARDE